MTFILGLTGSVGMGKSTTAAMFRELGVPVHDADATVHTLYRSAAVPLIEVAFPGTTGPDGVDRDALGARVLGDKEAMAQLEAIVHPLVREAEQNFLDQARKEGAALVVLDIPLLFETGAENRCDAVLVVSADHVTQRARVLARPGMTEERFNMIHVKQLPDAEKRRRAHFIVDTGRGLDAARRQVRHVVRTLSGRSGRRQGGDLNVTRDRAGHGDDGR
jgi:dephospho-CoA kinase